MQKNSPSNTAITENIRSRINSKPPSFDNEFVDKIMNDLAKLSSIPRIKVAESANTSPLVLTALADDKSKLVRHAVFTNPRTPDEALHKLIDSVPSDLIPIAVKHSKVPDKILVGLPYHKLCGLEFKLASHPGTSFRTLTKLSRDSRATLREVVARNNATPSGVLKYLALDCSERVVQAVSTNTMAQISIRKLAKKQLRRKEQLGYLPDGLE
jgi:hypothetical protein